MVEDQPVEGGRAHRGGPDAPRRSRGGRAREGRRALGRGLRLAAHDHRARRPACGARCEPRGAGVLRRAGSHEPLRDPLSPARRQASRNAAAAAREVRGDVRAGRNAVLHRGGDAGAGGQRAGSQASERLQGHDASVRLQPGAGLVRQRPGRPPHAAAGGRPVPGPPVLARWQAAALPDVRPGGAEHGRDDAPAARLDHVPLIARPPAQRRRPGLRRPRLEPARGATGRQRHDAAHGQRCRGKWDVRVADFVVRDGVPKLENTKVVRPANGHRRTRIGRYVERATTKSCRRTRRACRAPRGRFRAESP